jgi:glutathione synthase/RimK-type ligase-like ATP-grasp enzyme/gamma-glutamyl:cysteine ligase YbdK (ATP-grasp superfamily)
MGKRVHVVVSVPGDARDLPAEWVVTADRYLEGPGEFNARDAVVINLCRSYRYRTKGYYVSLLAAARDQDVMPSVETIEGLADPFTVFRSLEEAGIATVDRGTNPTGPVHDTLVLLGSSEDPRFRDVALAVYREWPAPLLRLRLVEQQRVWSVAGLQSVPPHDLTHEERARFASLLRDESLLLRRGAVAPREEKRAAIAVLVDPNDPFTPSTPETVERLERVAARMNVHVRRIGLGDIDRLGEYDALFIRALTGVREPAFQFALRAEALGMPTIDDAQSIIRCSNKVFLEELLRREGIPTPQTLVVTSRTPWEHVCELGDPFVIKLPDGSFSASVHKVSSQAEYRSHAAEMFRRSPLIIAQEYLPTKFDWRITVLDGKPLFAARYFMASGHWQIRSETGAGERYGRVEAVSRERAPREIVALALRAAALIGDGIYGVDIKETPSGPVIIEINDNPNIDRGDEDAADGDQVYEDIVSFFLGRIEETGKLNGAGNGAASRTGSRRSAETKRHYRPFEVAGMELEYAVVDHDLEPISAVEQAFRAIAGRLTSDVEIDGVGFSNEIADHVFEIKTLSPTASLRDAEELLVRGVLRFSETLRTELDARLLPTGMHPWFDPREARIWRRSGTGIYETYARIFDVQTHGWMNVHAAHLNLPLGREEEAVALHNAAALLVPYLPAIAASSPVFDGRVQPELDGRMRWILEHQAALPESQGEIVPELVESLADYRKRILGSMYTALDRFPDSGRIRHEFLNARGAVIRFSRKALEVRVVDVQECVKLDVAIAVFVRSALRLLTRQLVTGRIAFPAHRFLVADLRATIQHGRNARVMAPHLGDSVDRSDDGAAAAGEVLRELLAGARRVVRRDEAPYLDLVEKIIAEGSLAERIRGVLEPVEADESALRDRLREVYGELADCLVRNEPWSGRGW